MSQKSIDRKAFIKTVSMALAVTAGTGLVDAASLKSKKRKRKQEKMIGIQIGAVSFVDEGENEILDNVQELAKVNTLFLPVFAYNKGLAGRGYRQGDQRLIDAVPDHGLTKFDPNWFHGGYYATPHMKYYKNTVFKDLRAPEFGDYDMLADVLPKAKKRGMKCYAMMADNFRRDLPNAEKLMQIDLYGNIRSTVCFNNPEFQGFLMGLIEDCVRSYDIDGLLWRSEKTGPLSEVLGLSHSSGGPRTPGCFCQFCRARAKEQGIHFERAKQGYVKLHQFMQDGHKDIRPIDGYYVTFWRILLQYPEILQWQSLFTQSLRNTYKMIYQKVKSIKPELPAGWGLSSQQIYSHIYRADNDIKVLAGYTDFLKFYIYYNAGGPRMAKYIDHLSKGIFHDVPKEQLLQFVHRLMGYDEEGGYEDIRRNGLSADFVYRETQRALANAEGTGIKMWPAIDIDLPSRRYWKGFDDYPRSNPETIKRAISAVFKAGSDRILLARKYSEMRLTNLKAAGQALAEI